MKYSIFSRFQITHLVALLVLIALISPINNVDAQNRIFQFYIENPDTDPNSEVKVTLTSGSCYQGNIPNSQNYYIKAGTKRLLGDIARDQDDDCDGEPGYFTLTFSPNPREQSAVNFTFSNSGGLATYGANQYPGTLQAKSGNSYTYITYKWPKASKVVGRWERICAGVCNEEVTEGFSLTEGTEQTNSSQVTNAVSVALTVGPDYAQGTVAASSEKSLTDTFSRIVNGTKSSFTTKRVVLTQKEMSDLGIHAIWKWVGETQYEGSSYTIATSITTCTSGPQPPTYSPLDQQTVGTCTGQLKIE